MSVKNNPIEEQFELISANIVHGILNINASLGKSTQLDISKNYSISLLGFLSIVNRLYPEILDKLKIIEKMDIPTLYRAADIAEEISTSEKHLTNIEMFCKAKFYEIGAIIEQSEEFPQVLENLKNTLRNMKGLQTDYEQTKRQLTAVSAQEGELIANILEMKDLLKEYAQITTKLEIELQDKYTSYLAKQKEYEALIKQKKHLDDTYKENIDVELQNLRDEVTSLKKDHDRIKKELDSENIEYSALQTRIKILNEKRIELEDTKAKMNLDSQRLEQQNSNLVVQLSSAEQELTKISAEHEILTSSYNKMEEQRLAFKKYTDSYNQAISGFIEIATDLKKTISIS